MVALVRLVSVRHAWGFGRRCLLPSARDKAHSKSPLRVPVPRHARITHLVHGKWQFAINDGPGLLRRFSCTATWASTPAVAHVARQHIARRRGHQCGRERLPAIISSRATCDRPLYINPPVMPASQISTNASPQHSSKANREPTHCTLIRSRSIYSSVFSSDNGDHGCGLLQLPCCRRRRWCEPLRCQASDGRARAYAAPPCSGRQGPETGQHGLKSLEFA